jgi:hypothetical protein
LKMELTKRLSVFFSVVLLVLLNACGAGGGVGIASVIPGGGGGIGGTGVTSSGTIDSFGSIFVNGIEFETSNAAILLDGRSASEDDLAIGMIVVVSGTLNADGITGIADSVAFDDELQGPIEAIVPGADGNSLILTVLGVPVIVERNVTVFEGTSLVALAIHDLIEISGFLDANGQIQATRIERKSRFSPGSSEVEVKGVVNDLSALQFSLRDVVVDFSEADLSELPGGALSDGMAVDIRGTFSGRVITARKIKKLGGLEDRIGQDEEVGIQGAITNFVSIGRFSVDGLRIDASGADLTPANLLFQDGVIVEVEGVWSGTELVARALRGRRGLVKIEAHVASIDNGKTTLMMQLFGGTINVRLNASTTLDDDTDQVARFSIADIAAGNFLKIEAVQVGALLFATSVSRGESDDDVVRAPLERFNDGIDVTILGITWSTAGAEFESQNDSRVDSAAFYSGLKLGDLIKVRDDEIADGVADEVEFEGDD